MEYLDNAATTQPFIDAVNSAVEVLSSSWANPNSKHLFGLEALDRIVRAKNVVADCLETTPEHLFFTTSATEANAAVLGIDRFCWSMGASVEHASIRHSLDKEIGVDSNGVISLDELDKELNCPLDRKGRVLICCQYGNQETGVIQPIEEVSAIAKRNDAYVFMDATQGFGKVEINPDKLGVDFMTGSAHKIHGIPGCGFVWARDPDLIKLSKTKPILDSTPNVAAIVAFAAAVKENTDRRRDWEVINRVGEDLQKALKNSCKARINGEGVRRIPGLFSVTLPCGDVSLMMVELEKNGFIVSSRSACEKNESNVLKAMGMSEVEAKRTFRVCIGMTNNLRNVMLLPYSIQKVMAIKSVI
jgi:cysteine desulfurase